VDTVRDTLAKPSSVRLARFVCFSAEDLAVYGGLLGPAA